MSSILKHFSTRETPQSEPIPGKAMAKNSAGGYTFEIDDWKRLDRFLILGSEGGSYYASERALTVENARCVVRCVSADAARAVRTIVEVSEAGRAPKNDPAVLALAIAAGSGPPAAVMALEALPRVCRIGTHLFGFAEAVEKVRGWGPALRKAVARWYDRPVAELAFQLGKYQSRNGWSHRDLLRLAHAKADDPARQAAFRWAVGGKEALGPRTVKRGDAVAEYPDVAAGLPRFLAAVDESKHADEAGIIRLIREDRLPRECVPTEHLNSPRVWEALLEEMPPTALLRSLSKLSAVGLLVPLSDAAKAVAARIGDAERLRRARVHPLAVLLAQAAYASGHGLKGKLSWTPVSTITDALDAAFYAAFGNVTPAGKRTLIGLDVSGSMSGGGVAGTPLTPREGAAALAMITARAEPEYQVMAFQSAFVPLDVSRSDRLSDVVSKAADLPFGPTDCATPMIHAMEHKLSVDTFIVLTDNETWAGSIHPTQALQRYRQRSGLPARLIVVGMTATSFTIADPTDAGMLDVVGFDAAAPDVMASFSRGDF
jgi:60 kDa SS-A/Ro ribonucleoprotein